MKHKKIKETNCGSCGNVGCHLCMDAKSENTKTQSPLYLETLKKSIEILNAKGYRGF
jgi:hypothetical protein